MSSVPGDLDVIIESIASSISGKVIGSSVLLIPSSNNCDMLENKSGIASELSCELILLKAPLYYSTNVLSIVYLLCVRIGLRLMTLISLEMARFLGLPRGYTCMNAVESWLRNNSIRLYDLIGFHICNVLGTNAGFVTFLVTESL